MVLAVAAADCGRNAAPSVESSARSPSACPPCPSVAPSAAAASTSPPAAPAAAGDFEVRYPTIDAFVSSMIEGGHKVTRRKNSDGSSGQFFLVYPGVVEGEKLTLDGRSVDCWLYDSRAQWEKLDHWLDVQVAQMKGWIPKKAQVTVFGNVKCTG
ncbi:MAG: hypothetical protein HYV09_07855 [Deltaproteobacteria bacterium]|nr:hypothetical protein [Deltaproteobacteria bacterium]